MGVLRLVCKFFKILSPLRVRAHLFNQQHGGSDAMWGLSLGHKGQEAFSPFSRTLSHHSFLVFLSGHIYQVALFGQVTYLINVLHPRPCSTSPHFFLAHILSHPMTTTTFVTSCPPSPPALKLYQHQGLFQWVCSSHQVAKVLELQLQHQSFQ